MNKNNLIAGFFRYHREKLNYSQRGLINDSSPVKESSLCDFENGKRMLNDEQLVYLFQQIGFDYHTIIKTKDYSDEYNQILDMIFDGELDKAIDLYEFHKNDGIFSTLGTVNFALIEYLILVMWKKDYHSVQTLIYKCEHLLSSDQKIILKICEGKIGVFEGNYTKSILAYEECLKFSFKYSQRAWINFSLGTAYSKCGDYYNAQKYTEESLLLYSKEMNFKRMVQIYLNIGTICMLTNSIENAEMSYLKAYKAALGLKDSYKIITKCFENLCWLHFNINQYDKFEQFSSEEIGNLVLNENTYFVLAWAYYKTGRVEECVKYCKEAREKYKDREYPQIVFTYIERAVLGKKSGQDTLLKKAITMEDYEHNKEIDELFTLELIDIYEHRKNYEKAYKYTRKLLNR